MITLDRTWLSRHLEEEVPEPFAKDLLAAIYGYLEVEVGKRLSQGLTDDEISEFVGMEDRNGDASALVWLREHRPDLDDVVREVLAEVEQALTDRRGAVVEQAAAEAGT